MQADMLLIDNHDSFTFNLVECFAGLGLSVRVIRNDIAADEALQLAIDGDCAITISPGPGHPRDAGCTVELIRKAKGRVPLLGVCLGQQAMVYERGGEIARADEIVHGKSFAIEHDGSALFEGIPNPLRVGRYHSLCTPDPPGYQVHARIGRMAMAISDPGARQYAVQFHPESVLTPHGDKLIGNIVRALGRPSGAALLD
jgi:anthranilate synthase/aminodeoxychorismate synthase-like glutamine amidotransferase